TMRLIQGESLHEAIVRLHQSWKSRVEARESSMHALISRFVSVCQTVAYAHSRGIVHHDLKPTNIMLGEFGETLVVDWGLATCAGDWSEGIDVEGVSELPLPPEAADLTPRLKGTPAFMSPEQAVGLPATPASDIYSLGATLYAILTGQPPFAS